MAVDTGERDAWVILGFGVLGIAVWAWSTNALSGLGDELAERATTVSEIPGAAGQAAVDTANAFGRTIGGIFSAAGNAVTDTWNYYTRSSDDPGNISGLQTDRTLLRGIRLNNPGNLVKGVKPFDGEVSSSDPKFRAFTNPIMGMRAIGKTALTYNSRGINTALMFAHTYAPESDGNSPDAYAQHLASRLGLQSVNDWNWEDNLYDPNWMAELIRAIVVKENGYDPDGGEWYTDADYATAAYSALGMQPPNFAWGDYF